ncbi:MAG: PaaI family thioesterase [Caulobacteraceae bacterium]|nr:PaaI family thioesterase [Caulobacteraceae bacterium]
MSETPAPPTEFPVKVIDGSPLGRALQFETVAMETATATLKAPYLPEMVGDPDTGVIAGGVVTALLDHASGQAVFAALGYPTGIATLDLRIDYMRPAEPGLDIFARAHCYKLTHSIGFVRAVAYDRTADDPVATAQAAFMLGTGEAPMARPGQGPEAGR